MNLPLQREWNMWGLHSRWIGAGKRINYDYSKTKKEKFRKICAIKL